MGTKGNILIRDNDDNHGIWLHACHTGHATEAGQALFSMPDFYVKRSAIAYNLQALPYKDMSKEDHPFPRDEYGFFGDSFLTTWSLTCSKEQMIEKGYTDFDEMFQSSWRSGTSNITFCDSSFVANLMINRFFMRWNVITQVDREYHGAIPDIEVVCQPDASHYHIVNHWLERVPDGYWDAFDCDPPPKRQPVLWGETIKRLFSEECRKITFGE